MSVVTYSMCVYLCIDIVLCIFMMERNLNLFQEKENKLLHCFKVTEQET